MTADHLIERYEYLRDNHENDWFLPDAIDQELVWLEWLLPSSYRYPGDDYVDDEDTLIYLDGVIRIESFLR